MKKRIKLIGVILILAMVCCGCGIVNADSTRDIRHSGFSLSGAEFECSDLLPSITEYKRIEFLTGTHAITNDGKVYSLSLSQKYSNEKNCMEADLATTAVSVFDGKVIRGKDGKLYYLSAVDNMPAYSPVPSSANDYQLYRLLLNDDNVVKVITVDAGTGIYYVLKKDGNVHNYVVSKGNNGSVSLISSSIVYSRNDYGGEIVDFNYAGKASSTFVKTNEKVFRMVAQNRDTCTKYADIQCEYRMVLDEGLTEHYDKILGFSGSLLITTYGKEFNATA